MIIPTALLVACTMSLTVFAGPLYRMTDAAALALLERTPYITAVLGL